MMHSFQSSIYQYLFFTSIIIGYSIGGRSGYPICRFAEPDKTVYWIGEFISGTFEFESGDYPDMKVKRIDAELVGELIYYNTNKKYLRMVPIFKDKRRLQSNGDQKYFLLADGNHNWPFSFRLNEALPPSIGQTAEYRPYIHYYLRILFVRPEWHKFNIDEKFVVVLNRSSSSVKAKQLEAQKKNRKNVLLNLILQKNIVVDGNELSLDVNVQNPKQVLIRRISVKLRQIWEIYPKDVKKISVFDDDVKGIRRFRGKHFKGNFQLRVPRMTPATFTFDSLPLSDVDKIVVRYELHIQAHMCGFFTNIRLQFPVIITNINEKQTNKTLPSFSNHSTEFN